MESTELRIGNYYLSFGVDLKQVEELTKDKMLIDFHPIPLNKEWLIKFGFEKINDVAEMWNAKYVWAINYLPTHKNNFALFETHSFGLKKPEHYNFENKVFDFRCNTHVHL